MSFLFNSLLNRIRAIIQDEIEEIVRKLIRTMAIAGAGIVLLLIGLISLSIAAVKYVSAYLGSSMLGYGVVGVALLAIGGILILAATRSARAGRR